MSANTKKTAFLFSGQGVQTSIVREYFNFLKNKDSNKTDDFLRILQDSLDIINAQEKIDIKETLENESLALWTKTSFVQPLTYTLSILAFELIQRKGLSNYDGAYMLGHSLGAISALTASGSLPFEQGCLVVAARGKFMQEESEKADNGMLAVIGLTKEKVEEICNKTNTTIALINAPTAYVIGCARDIFPQVEQEALKHGAAKTIRLGTSGAFHTKAMQGAYEKLKEFLKQYTFNKPRIPIVSNMQGSATDDPDILKNDIIDSMINPVDWVRMMEFLKSNNVRYYIETGPGTSLMSLSRLNGIEKESILHAKSILE